MEKQLNNAFSFAHRKGKTYWFDGNLLEVKATGEETNGIFSVIEGVHPAGYETPLHIHHHEEESMYVLEGELTYTIGDTTVTAKPGTFIYAPRNIQHKFKIEGTGAARTLSILSPAGVEGFYMESGVEADAYKLPPDTIMPDLNKMMAAAQKYGIEIVGR